MEAELSRAGIRTDHREFDKALAWARLSLQALMMNQTGRGIFAGLPWFNNYWGRDTFIALPGATLVTGAFAEAREIIRSFSAFQQRDSASSDYGRIPNIVTTTDTAFNTADGTPRFVIMAREYVERSGDDAFLLEAYPVVLRSIEGTLRYHTDALGFLTHADAETWMDAVGPSGPWSPRGNRANDIQALWAQQLEAGIWFATRLGDVAQPARGMASFRKSGTHSHGSSFLTALLQITFPQMENPTYRSGPIRCSPPPFSLQAIGGRCCEQS
jgi:predicted glycogen debranching enzyme